jgi:hypothetical protein
VEVRTCVVTPDVVTARMPHDQRVAVVADAGELDD